MSIKLWTKDEFDKMSKVGKLAAQLLNELEAAIKPGISTQYLDDVAADFITKYGAKSACLGYRNRNSPPFPKYICTSVNHVICHGIPNEKQILQDGDIIGIDITIIVDGWHGDTCKTFPVGAISNEKKELLIVTEDALNVGIQAAKNTIGNIGHAIANLIKTKYNDKYSIVEDYCGHGIGDQFHMSPEVRHNWIEGAGPKIQPGMFFTIEPMINIGNKETRLLKDGWTVVTKDFSCSAQFEHTIGITEDGPMIFTR
jgi:methionyl aminopeptidase